MIGFEVLDRRSLLATCAAAGVLVVALALWRHRASLNPQPEPPG